MAIFLTYLCVFMGGGVGIWIVRELIVTQADHKLLDADKIQRSIGYMFLGGVAGGLSLFLYPHPLVHRSRVPGLSLVISPVLAGVGMSLVGSEFRKRNRKAMQLESFGYGFAFAFGMALVRFFFAK